MLKNVYEGLNARKCVFKSVFFQSVFLRNVPAYLIFVNFSPQTLFLAKFFSTQKRVNRKINFATKQRKLPKKKTNFPSKQCKRQQNTINCRKNEGDFRILHICHVKKFEINPHVDEF